MDTLEPQGALPGSVDGPRVVELLSHWDELPRDLRSKLADHPVHGPRLQHLRRVETYLAGSACPQAEELYDFARGPGYAPLSKARRQEVEDHLAHCGECEELVETLGSSPPLPLDLDGEPAEPPRRARPGPFTPRRSVERWLPLAAAAAVLALGLLVFRGGTVDAGDKWPEYPLLRGPAAEALCFPRDEVLARGTVPGGGWAAAPRFEVRPVEGAERYRVVLREHAGGAFGDGEVLATLGGDRDDLVAADALPPGHYTWEAWVTVDGLERLLGERDFGVVRDDEVRANLASLNDLERVHALHEAGWWTDARALARRMHPSVGRDAYLDGTPGR